MLTSIIQFPDIGTEIFAVDIGSFRFALRWYALAYIVGLLIGWRICVALVSSSSVWGAGAPPLQPKQLEDLLTWIILGVIVGGRLLRARMWVIVTSRMGMFTFSRIVMVLVSLRLSSGASLAVCRAAHHG